MLLHGNRLRTGRHRRTGEDAQRLAWGKLRVRPTRATDTFDNLEDRRFAQPADRVTIHRGMVKYGQGARAFHVPRQYAAATPVERQCFLPGDRGHFAHHIAACGINRQERGRGRNISHAAISTPIAVAAKPARRLQRLNSASVSGETR